MFRGFRGSTVVPSGSAVGVEGSDSFFAVVVGKQAVSIQAFEPRTGLAWSLELRATCGASGFPEREGRKRPKMLRSPINHEIHERAFVYFVV
ncbi:MAG: hypothetical protein LAP85_09905 [Acidobacteriia bacterium]|nr:hypothetical protein [Terriglobia bacterium]